MGGVIRRLNEVPYVRAIVTSHYPELHDALADSNMQGVKFSHFEYVEHNSDLDFPHVKMNGPNTRGDYGVVIARHEHVPDSVARYAEHFMREHAK